MQANDITTERLRHLAGIRARSGKVVSLFVNLDPREFATPPARATEVRSIVDRAWRQAREDESLTGSERAALRADLDRVRSELANGSTAIGAHGLAVFVSGSAGLFELLRLSQPVDHPPVIADTPFIEPLSAIGAPERWCVLLANRRIARLFCGDGNALEEVALVEDDVRGRHDQGGWSQANYQRSIDKDAADHLKHAAEVAFARLKRRLPAGILIGAPGELAGALEGHLHPYLRERLAGRIDIDVEHSSPEDIRKAAAPAIDAAARAAQDEALDAFAGDFAHDRAASGLGAVLDAMHQQRVRALLVDDGFSAPGVVCPACGWMGAGDAGACPADGTATQARDDIVDAAIRRALSQAAAVHVLRDRPELASHGHVAALLRY
jgi:peptide subunit release factor 1 (eRF1)